MSQVFFNRISMNVVTQEKWPFKAGQLAAHRRFICIGNVILGNGQVASHRRLAARKSGCSEQVLLYILYIPLCHIIFAPICGFVVVYSPHQIPAGEVSPPYKNVSL